ncbi:Cysteine oxygenase/2-aminoethanethiol dioxygenase [Dillenia turbinata]|uniref:cysteine dioxygenase n=1 Tax=Dillenia turbinata TaxID=194707 RepID=A0AAN8UME0_9MAGN
MGIEPTLVDRKGKDLCELSEETNSRSRRNRRRQKKMVQKLFEACKDVFASGGTDYIPPQADVDRLRAILDKMTPEDVGLTPEMRYFRILAADEPPIITYLCLHECDKFSIGIFCLPPSGVIPLHNHPGMTVFSKLLFGSMHIKSYDWAIDVPSYPTAVPNPAQSQSPGVKLAKVKVDADLTAPCNTSILYPADCNMHCFKAVTACAFLDVLGPPYSDRDGRHCTYYFDYPFSSFSVDGVSVPEGESEGYSWLQEREEVDDLIVVGALYQGPKIVTK